MRKKLLLLHSFLKHADLNNEAAELLAVLKIASRVSLSDLELVANPDVSLEELERLMEGGNVRQVSLSDLNRISNSGRGTVSLEDIEAFAQGVGAESFGTTPILSRAWVPSGAMRMPSGMQTSRDGIERLRGSEGFRKHVYDDHTGQHIASYSALGSGNPTIGYGHLIRDSERDRFSEYLLGQSEMTAQEAEDLFVEDIRKHEVPWKNQINVPLTQAMFDALTSFAFNTGAHGPSRYGVIEPLNRVDSNGSPIPDYEAAAEAIRNGPQTSNGRRLRGLVTRRNREADDFLAGFEPSDFA